MRHSCVTHASLTRMMSSDLSNSIARCASYESDDQNSRSEAASSLTHSRRLGARACVPGLHHTPYDPYDIRHPTYDHLGGISPPYEPRMSPLRSLRHMTYGARRMAHGATLVCACVCAWVGGERGRRTPPRVSGTEWRLQAACQNMHTRKHTRTCARTRGSTSTHSRALVVVEAPAHALHVCEVHAHELAAVLRVEAAERPLGLVPTMMEWGRSSASAASAAGGARRAEGGGESSVRGLAGSCAGDACAWYHVCACVGAFFQARTVRCLRRARARARGQTHPVPNTHMMTCTCALITSVSATVKPSSTLDSSMNFFHPQSCSFLQNTCSVSAQEHGVCAWGRGPWAHGDGRGACGVRRCGWVVRGSMGMGMGAWRAVAHAASACGLHAPPWRIAAHPSTWTSWGPGSPPRS
jgi:hypothetical protein